MSALPHNLEAERSLLGGLLQSPEHIGTVAQLLGPKLFYNPQHGALFELLCHMHERREPIDLVTVPERCARGGVAERYGGVVYVVTLADKVPSSANLSHYAEIVARKAQQRMLIEVAGTAIARADSDSDDPATIIDQAVATLGSIRGMGDIGDEPMSVGDAISEALDDAERMVETGESPGVSTGFSSLDEWLAGVGLDRQTFTVIGGRPSQGKSALALNLAMNIALGGDPAGFCSLEMSKKKVVNRLLAAYTGINLSIVKNPAAWSTKDWEDLMDARDALREVPFLLWCTKAPTVDAIRTMSLRWSMQRGRLGALFIDYLSLLDSAGQPPHIAIDVNSKRLCALAAELDAPVVAVHPINRSVDRDRNSNRTRRPGLADLQDCGKLEYHLDYALFVHREAYYNRKAANDLAEIIIAKQRNGPVGTAEMLWHGGHQRFKDIPKDAPSGQGEQT